MLSSHHHGLHSMASATNNQLNLADANDVHRRERDRLRHGVHAQAHFTDDPRRKRSSLHHPQHDDDSMEQSSQHHHQHTIPTALHMDILSAHQQHESTIWRRRFPESSWRSPKLRPPSSSTASNQDDGHKRHHHIGLDL
ncbi:hypothetical protein H257_03419 [Aphanomyces astaci]|uniref:Uncharacterized protein n=1 Tax=Aphanomyces astaci TaxID=112090 RepID=W4GYN8_APHAT|nr:hypothetical protein H257_03419 [Aphanomyces astaci]ETV84109.1 hypothetical protein H257_03419 [Aphanomyces astaci]|eukprot:XP_009825801.1 hypothetical protein H257_03419 [Aphanomyces astaci]